MSRTYIAHGHRRIARVLAIVFTLCISACVTAQVPPTRAGHLVIGQVDSLYSNVLQEHRELWISLPDGFREGERYPVIYLLDPTAHFHAFTGIVGLRTQWDMPSSIVVGINTSDDRIGDLTPTHVPFNRGHDSATSGRAPAFARFIETELQPYIASRFPTESMSTIVGHSTGGLFVIYAYLHHAELFDNYLAIEPSLWWDAETLVSESEDILGRRDHRDRSLYVAAVNGTGIDTVAVRSDTTVDTEQLRANLRFHDLLVQNESRLDFQWDFFGVEYDHSSVVVPALYDGLGSLFSWYGFPERWRFNTPDQYTADELTAPFYAHFADVSRRMKREVRPDWRFINDVGFFLLTGHEAPEKAQAYLEMNLDFYPDSSKTYVALGNFHEVRGQREEAIHYFERAVEMDGNEEARKSLRSLIENN